MIEILGISLTPAWAWWSLAGILFIIELTVPGAFFLWLGIAAGLTGLVALGVDNMSAQIIVFSILSVASVWLWKVWRKPQDLAAENSSSLNQRGQLYIGRTFSLEEPIVGGKGRARVDDGSWIVTGPDLPAGTKVKVVSVEGVVFKVESLES